ncbi:hypothetical protein GCM10007147_28720 [Nocardiopsis kunsanensis]|uniref:Uncharacterized protein n=2 Tax=Nocardiopsis kunsanensis TaxID=141693 RepID=A0A919CIR5_9ACTN|nr:hypothetical protein GCM10007147_28720 [Nocardiopsis kunsanensis]
MSERLSALVGTEPKTLYPPTEREDMHKVAKIAITGLFAAGLVGAGVGTAAAGSGGDEWDTDVVHSCVQEQQALGLINLDLDLLNQCISNADA